MNRLIIIGNGFDLAHGLPTRFSNFYLAHIKDALKKFRIRNPLIHAEGFTYHDFLSLEYQSSGPIGEGYTPLREINLDNEADLKEIVRITHKTSHRLKLKGLFNSLIPKNDIENWVDVERIYFNQLRKAASNTNDLDTNLSEVEILNKSLRVFMQYFEDYLNKEICPLINPEIKIEAFESIFSRPSDRHYVVNFNYTNLIELYNRYSVSSNVTHIHGQVNNNMVFGYGDEHNDHYKAFENFQENHFLEFSKSPWYTTDQGYLRMINFMDNVLFEVYIIGHSCGLSDRTLLKGIFEHPNCRKITLFHRGSMESHRSAAINLSRHFDNKNDMRKKVVPYQKANRCPQFDD